MSPDDDEPVHKQDDDIPRQSLFSAFPKRAFYRVVVLLTALGAILYLRQRTGAIASCMSSSFQALPPSLSSPTSPTIRAAVVFPDGGRAEPRR